MIENKLSPRLDPGGSPKSLKNPRRILVVDDDADLRQLNQEVLVQHGYLADAAENGVAAWKILQVRNYDLLITDNEMPQGTGVELLTKLHAVHKALPTIMATGKPPKELVQYPWLQPTAVLIKPFTTTEFVEKVQEVLRLTDDMQFI
jgi:DNA-binding response OmpR family regulator